MSELHRIPVRRFMSGVTHYADVDEHHPCEVRHFVTDYLSPLGPLVALCGVTLDGNLVHMQKMGSARTQPKSCRMCVRFAERSPLRVLGALPADEVLDEIERRSQ